MRPIDADALKEAFLNHSCTEFEIKNKCRAEENVIALIDNVPTVEDNEPTLNESIAFNNGYELGKSERPQGEWENEHELSCGRILKLRINVIEHKCKKCKHWSIKWAGTIPDNFCSHCGADMRGENNG